MTWLDLVRPFLSGGCASMCVFVCVCVCVCVLYIQHWGFADLCNGCPLECRAALPPMAPMGNLTDSLVQLSANKHPTSKVQIPDRWKDDRGADAFDTHIVHKLYSLPVYPPSCCLSAHHHEVRPALPPTQLDVATVWQTVTARNYNNREQGDVILLLQGNFARPLNFTLLYLISVDTLKKNVPFFLLSTSRKRKIKPKPVFSGQVPISSVSLLCSCYCVDHLEAKTTTKSCHVSKKTPPHAICRLSSSFRGELWAYWTEIPTNESVGLFHKPSSSAWTRGR